MLAENDINVQEFFTDEQEMVCKQNSYSTWETLVHPTSSGQKNTDDYGQAEAQ